MNNIAELGADLGRLYAEIRSGAIDLKVASEMSNAAGKHLKVFQMQLAYHALRGEAPDIPYLAAESVMPKTTLKQIEAQAPQQSNGKTVSLKAGKH